MTIETYKKRWQILEEDAVEKNPTNRIADFEMIKSFWLPYMHE